jgi:hypothetical protein
VNGLDEVDVLGAVAALDLLARRRRRLCPIPDRVEQNLEPP